MISICIGARTCAYLRRKRQRKFWQCRAPGYGANGRPDVVPLGFAWATGAESRLRPCEISWKAWNNQGGGRQIAEPRAWPA